MQSKAFFRLEARDKMSFAHMPGPEPQRGWSKMGAENSSTLYRKGLLGSEVAEDRRDARVWRTSINYIVQLNLT